jgi:hypothetical protein
LLIFDEHRDAINVEPPGVQARCRSFFQYGNSSAWWWGMSASILPFPTFAYAAGGSGERHSNPHDVNILNLSS